MNQPKRKLIEVALPLEAINVASAREKSIRHGHPSTLHLWWARRPLATCRAVLFAQLVDDPSAHPDRFPTEEAQERERQRLFRIIEELVKWENTTNEAMLEQAREEIRRSCDGNPPPVLDPFCGGGSIPLEAQRLGLEAHASDLNPVAVLITKALIEIPPKLAGRPPVNRRARSEGREARDKRGQGSLFSRSSVPPSRSCAGLAEDVRYYGQWIRDEAEKRIGHLYPKATLPDGSQATVIAWLWARTVECPNPACKARMPLVKSFWLSKKKGKEAWVEPIVDQEAKTVRFEVREGAGGPREGTVANRAATCCICGATTKLDYVRSQGKAGRMGAQLMAVVAEGDWTRVYLPPDAAPEAVLAPDETARVEAARHGPLSGATPARLTGGTCHGYGLTTWWSLFTPRQLVALTTFSDLVGEAIPLIERDAAAAGMADDGIGLEAGGTGARAYAEAVGTYLAFAVDKCTDYWNTIATWCHTGGFIRNCFARQAIPMSWDFVEGNPLSGSTANWSGALDWVARVADAFVPAAYGTAEQADAALPAQRGTLVVSTDPPYYDNVGYADLSDFFYVWLRRTVGGIYPTLFGTLLVPKAEELVAAPHRFEGGKAEAARFFEAGLERAFEAIRRWQHPDYPMTVYYAFKQEESEGENDGGTAAVASTGWETMLSGLLTAGFHVTGTWPMRTERSARTVSLGTNALASSIVLVCRPRPQDAPTTTRRGFLSALRAELPDALRTLQQGNVAPVDFAQAAIGPGMAVFSRYARVLEADGSPMTVRTALQIINQELDAFLAEQEGHVDGDTRFCIAWFEQRGMAEGAFGEADVLARAKNTSVSGLVEAGVLHAAGGKVRLRRRVDYPEEWRPGEDARVPVWEATQHLVKALEEGGEGAAADLAARLGPALSDEARALAYRLYSISDRRGWSDQALAYNNLVTAWPEIMRRTGVESTGTLL